MSSHEEFEKKMIERFNNLNLKEGDLILAYDKGIVDRLNGIYNNIRGD